MKRKLFITLLCSVLFIEPFFCANTSNAQVFVMGNSSQKCLKGDGYMQTKIVAVLPFREVTVDGAFQVKILPGSKITEITINSDRNLIPFIDIASKADLLTVQASRSICSESPIQITIRTPNLDKLISEGVNDISVLKLLNSCFDVNLGGSGTLQVSGETRLLKAVVGGSADLQADKLRAENVDVVTSGSSQAIVRVVKKLNAQSMGASEIVYYGVPDHLMVDEREAGAIIAGKSGIIE